MHARINFGNAKTVDAGVEFRREKVLPVLRLQPGYRGGYVAADRSSGRIAVASHWDSAVSLGSSDAIVARLRKEGSKVFELSELRVEVFRLVAVHQRQPLSVGNALQIVGFDLRDLRGEEQMATERIARAGTDQSFRGAELWANVNANKGLAVARWVGDIDASATLPIVLRKFLGTSGSGRGTKVDSCMIAEVLLVDAAAPD